MTHDNGDSNVWLTPLVSEDGFHAHFRGDYVHVTLGSTFQVEPSQRDLFWAKLGKICAEHNSRRILVEGFVPSGERSTQDVVDAGLHTAAVPQLWLAFHLKDFVPDERSELFEAIAASKGVRVKFFPNSETALKWLRHNTPA